jgi:hypothetical protein
LIFGFTFGSISVSTHRLAHSFTEVSAMVRLARAEVFDPSEVAVLHICARVVRRCFLFGVDPVTGINHDHRKVWIEDQLKLLASHFGIDLLSFAILSNHFHLILRSRPEVVDSWDDTEVARRWLMLCPKRKKKDRSPEEPNEFELNSIRNDPDKLATIRTRLSNVSWWMRLLCQNIGTRANQEDNQIGKFFQGRFRAVRILDEETLLACAAYVDLNPIRAAMAETLETSEFTSVQRRLQALQQADSSLPNSSTRVDSFLSPLTIDEKKDPTGACANKTRERCSDKGFVSVSIMDYLELLDVSARIVRPDKSGHTPSDVAPIFERLKMDPAYWRLQIQDFGRLFANVAGKPTDVYALRSLISKRRFNLKHLKPEPVQAG